jgi:2-dehydropantoate 2-reductase
MPYGKILEREGTRRAMEAIVRECYAVGAARGVALEPPTADGYLELLTGALVPKTASHFPSMLQDLKRGKRTEIEALNGAIARSGRELGVSALQNQKVAEAIRKISPK